MADTRAPHVLGVPGLRSIGDDPRVIDEDGRLLATLSPASHRYRFAAEDPDGELLCWGRPRVVSGWLVRDADGTDLLTMSGGMFGRYRITLVASSRSLLLRGRAYRGDLHVADGNGTGLPALFSDPEAGAGAFGDRDWVIRTDGSLTLPEAIGIIEVHRLEMRRRRKPAPPRFAMPTPRHLRGMGRQR